MQGRILLLTFKKVNIMMGKQAPSASDLTKYSVNASGDKDVIWQPLYDYQTYAAGGQTSLNFFQNPVGQQGKTLEDTNMLSAGQLPAPQLFIVEAISIDFFPGNPVNMEAVDADAKNWSDVYTFMKSGWLDFGVGNKSRLQQAPLGAFPPPYRLGGSSAVTGAAAAANTITGMDYASMAGQPFGIIPVTLPANQNFTVSLNWAAAVPINTNARVGVKLHGNLYRSVQ